MTPERWKRVRELFEAAVERRPDERAAFLDQACGGDPSLRGDVDALLSSDRDAGSFIEHSPAWAAAGSGATVAALEPGSRLGPYEIEALIGSGGMGEVYRARDPRLGREVAVKVLSGRADGAGEPERRLEREARAAAALNHPGILAVYDVGRAGEVYYVVSELLEGESLRARLARGPLPWSRCLELVRQIVDALAAAHEKGIVHRDLKPDNLFLTHDGRAKILDFGLARQAAAPDAGREAPTQPLLTHPGLVLGTVGYMSPEQVRGLPADARSDLFSMGAVLYEMLAGRRAFSGGSAVETMGSILGDDPPPLARTGAPTALERILRRCLRKEPEARFQSARDLGFALEAVGDASAGSDALPEPAAAAPRHSVAVLPFLNMTGDAEQEYLCEGIAEELINALTRIEGLRVAARGSAFRLRARGDDVRRIGAELKVEKVLEGSVRRSGNRLRITAQLVNVADGYHVWSERYDRDMHDVFALQDEITARVVEALRLALDPRRPPARRHTEDVEAYQLYLKGLHFWNKRHEGGLLQGLRCFEQAIERDPRYAPAYEGLADSYAILGLSIYDGMPPREAMPKAKAAAAKALEIDPELAAPHAALAWIRLHYDWDWSAADQAFRRALELDPRRATSHHWHGFYLSAMGRFEEALAAARRAWELEPLSLIINSQLCQAHYYARRFEETAAAARRVMEMEPSFAVGRFWLGVAHAALGHFDDAVAEYEAFAEHGGGSSRARALIANAQARAARPEAARRTIVELRAAAGQKVPAFHFALAHAGLGERDEAFAWLEKAYGNREDQLAYLGVEPLLDPLRSDPRFDALVQRLRLPFAARASGSGRARAAHSRGRRSLAVLPFRDLSGGPASTHLGLGLADATITELAQLGSLLVRPTSAILRYQNEAIDPQQVARQLGVDAILDGSFQRDGSRLRATVRLVEAQDGRTLWAGKVYASLDDVFQMQDEVSRSVARALELQLTPAEEHRLGERARPGPNAHAYELYLKGKLHLLNESLADFVSAMDYFERARQADPGFALALAGLGAAYERIGFEYHPEGDWYARAKSMCDQALALHPDLPEALYLRGRLLWTPQAGFAHADAIRQLFAALRGRPNLDDAYVRLGVILYHVGLAEPAEHALQRALAISPEHLLARGHLAACLYNLGRHAESLETCQRLVARMPSYWMHYLIAHCHLKLGDLPAAERAVERMDREVPHDTTSSIRVLIAAIKHDAREAERQIEHTIRNEKAYGHYHHAQLDIACAYALLGRPTEACRWLADAARNGYPCAPQFALDPFLASLRGHEDFERLMEELRAQQAGYLRLYEEWLQETEPATE